MRTRAWLFLLLVVLAGCRRDSRVWRLAWSPDGRSCAKVAYYVRLPFLQEFLSFDVATPSYQSSIGLRDLTGYDSGMDLELCSAELAWSADSRFVAGLALPCSAQPIWFAFDTKTRRLVGPDSLKDMVRQAIRDNYVGQFPARQGLEPLTWVLTDEAHMAFARKLWGPHVDLHALTTEAPPMNPIVTGRPQRRR